MRDSRGKIEKGWPNKSLSIPKRSLVLDTYGTWRLRNSCSKSCQSVKTRVLEWEYVSDSHSTVWWAIKRRKNDFFLLYCSKVPGVHYKVLYRLAPSRPKVQPPYPFVTSYHFHVVANKWNDTAMTECIGWNNLMTDFSTFSYAVSTCEMPTRLYT